MSKERKNTIVELVRQVKEAIERAEERHPDKLVVVKQVDVEIKSTLKKEVGADGKVSWLPIPVELKAHHERSEIQTTSLSFVPESKPIVKMGAVADELADSIEVVRAGVEEAARTQPVFELKEACVILKLGTTSEGKVQVIVGGGVAEENVHTVKLTLGSVA